jgi:hypothetical protein
MEGSLRPEAYELAEDLRRQVQLLETKVHNLESEADGLPGNACTLGSDLQLDEITGDGSAEEDAQCPTTGSHLACAGETVRASSKPMDSGWAKWVYREDGHVRHTVICAASASIAALLFGAVGLVLQSTPEGDEECLECTHSFEEVGIAGPGPY